MCDLGLPCGKLDCPRIADDHVAVRSGVRSALASRPEVEGCGEADHGAEAVAKAIELKPDVVLLDIAMPILNGFQVARHYATNCQKRRFSSCRCTTRQS